MLSKKFFIPIGALIIAICAVVLFSLRSDVPSEPINIYKAVKPVETPAKATTAEVKETSTTDTAAGGHFHADGTWHSQPHSPVEVSQTSKVSEPHLEETAQERFDREMLEKMARKTARKAERDKFLSPILEKGKLLTSKYEDVFTITPDKYQEFSQDEKEEFYQQCVEIDRIVADIKEHFASLPKWMKDEIEKRRSGAIEKIINLPRTSDVYERLTAIGGYSDNEK